MGSPVKTALIFSSGKVVLTGATYMKQIDEGYNLILKSMKNY